MTTTKDIKDNISYNKFILPKSSQLVKFINSRPISAAVNIAFSSKMHHVNRNNDVRNLNALQPYFSGDAYSHKQRRIPINLDKEKLYVDNLSLKTKINRLKEELSNVRNDSQKKGIELSKKNKVIELINSEIVSRYNTEGEIKIDSKICQKAQETNLITNLKNHNKEIVQGLKEKKEEIETLKKNIKVTRMIELYEENKTLKEEVKKLLQISENYFNKTKEYEYSLFNNRNLIKENISLSDTVNKLSSYINMLSEKCIRLENDLKNKTEENEKKSKLNDNFNVKIPSIENKKNKLQKKNDKNFSQKSINSFYNSQDTNDYHKRRILVLENKLFEANNQIIHYKELNEKTEKKMMEMIHKSANISNLSNLNSDLKVFYHDTSTEKDEINNNNTWNSSQSKLKVNQSIKMIIDNKKLKPIKINDSKISLIDRSSIDPLSSNSKIDNNIPNYFFDSDQFKEFRYIFIKHIQSNKITLTEFEKIFSIIIGDEKLNVQISNKLCRFLKIFQEGDKLKVQYFINTLLKNSNNKLDFLKEKMILEFKSIDQYTPEQEMEFKHSLIQYLRNHKNYLNSKFKHFDPYSKGLIKFNHLKRMLDYLPNEMDDNKIEYLIYFMKTKRFLDKDSHMLLDDLNYIALTKLINEEYKINESDQTTFDYNTNETKYILHTDDNYSKIVIETDPQNEESEVVITTNQFEQRIDRFLNEISNILIKKGTNFQDYFRKHLSNILISEKTYNSLNIEYLQKELVENLIQFDDIDMFCVYNKYKISDDKTILLDVDKLCEDLKEKDYNIIISEESEKNIDLGKNLLKTSFEENKVSVIEFIEGEEKQEEQKKDAILLSNENILDNIDNKIDIFEVKNERKEILFDKDKFEISSVANKSSVNLIESNKEPIETNEEVDNKNRANIFLTNFFKDIKKKNDLTNKPIETNEEVDNKNRANIFLTNLFNDIKKKNYLTKEPIELNQEIDEKDRTKIHTEEKIFPGLTLPLDIVE